MAIEAQQTVGELVVEHPQRSRVFEALGVDYCCGGKQTLENACHQRGLNLKHVIELLGKSNASQEAYGSSCDPSAMSLTALADHIQSMHHEYLRSELPRTEQLVAKVADAHGERDPRLVRLVQVFALFREELMMHMYKEEQVLFPIIRDLELGSSTAANHCGSISNPIRQMESEHDDAGVALEVMRELTDGYQAPEAACNTHRAMLDALEHLERDMHTHVHKENNILFPSAILLETKLTRGQV